MVQRSFMRRKEHDSKHPGKAELGLGAECFQQLITLLQYAKALPLPGTSHLPVVVDNRFHFIPEGGSYSI